MSDNNLMPLSDELESAGTYWQTFDIGQGERRLDLLLGDETMLPPDDTSPNNIIEILVANHQARHTHANKNALDGITSENVKKWNNMGDHTHDEYATIDHVHEGYVSKSDLETKADSAHIHAEYSEINHSHSNYAEVSHMHDDYALSSHSHDDYAPVFALNEISSIVSEKADISHGHDDIYATVSHTHTASNVGAIPNTDIATVSEVETYLGI